MDDHIEQKITLKELADRAGYSPFYFSKLFSERMGISPTSYIRIRKLQYALVDLMAGYKVVDVAMKYAFESHEGFTRSFTRLFGSTPKIVRKYLEKCPTYVMPQIKKGECSRMKNNHHIIEDMHQIIFELMKQSLAEVKQGKCTEIKVERLPENRIRISDNGRGIRLSKENEQNKERINQIFAGHPITPLDYSAIEDFDNLGVQVACSLCEEMSVIIYKGEQSYQQDYVKGVGQHELIVRECDHRTGMVITLLPDCSIFGEASFSEAYIRQWVDKQAGLKKVIRIEVAI